MIGQLHGGYASCTSQTSDWYGKFSVSFVAGLSNHLDIAGSGQLTLNTLPGTGMSVNPGDDVLHVCTSPCVNPDPSEEINDISDVLMKYGVRYLGKGVVGDDVFSSVVTDKQQARLSYPFWMRIRGDALSQSHPTTADLNELFLVEAGSLEIKYPGKSIALITTSKNSGTLFRKHFFTKKPRELALSFSSDNQARIIAADGSATVPR